MSWTRGSVLGRGSTATVSLATSSCSSGDLLAVKSADLSRSALLRHEQKLYSSVGASPYLVSYLGFDITHESSGSYYNLLLEFAPGGSLSDEIKIRGGGIKETDARCHLRGILMALSHLHSRRIAHCDVKPQNVLICHAGRAKIADLGCARLLDHSSDPNPNPKGRFMGTPMYMAPEVARGEDQGTEADVWALGCTAVEMLTGRAPFPDARDPVALLHRVGFGGECPPVPDWVSDEGKDFLGKCLRREAKERWTVDELLMHPFVSEAGGPDCKRVSPKSVLLDQSYWDSLSEAEEEEETVDSLLHKPIQADEIFGCGQGPNWTWDEDWVTVRNDRETVGDESTASTSSGSSTGENVAEAVTTMIIITARITGEAEFMFSANDDDDAISAQVSDDYCERELVISLGECDDYVPDTMLMLSTPNKILDVEVFFKRRLFMMARRPLRRRRNHSLANGNKGMRVEYLFTSTFIFGVVLHLK